MSPALPPPPWICQCPTSCFDPGGPQFEWKKELLVTQKQARNSNFIIDLKIIINNNFPIFF